MSQDLLCRVDACTGVQCCDLRRGEEVIAVAVGDENADEALVWNSFAEPDAIASPCATVAGASIKSALSAVCSRVKAVGEKVKEVVSW